MSQQPDDDVFEHAGRKIMSGAMIAARAIEPIADALRRRAADRAAQLEADTRRALQNVEAQRRLMHAELREVGADTWWSTAEPADVVDAWRLADAWRDHDESAANIARSLEEQTPQHFDVDLQQLRVQVDAERRAQSEQAAQEEQAAAAAQEERASDLAAARAWLQQTDPQAYANWLQSHQFADTVAAGRSDEDRLIRQWRDATHSAAGHQHDADGHRREQEQHGVLAGQLLDDANRAEHDPHAPGAGDALRTEAREHEHAAQTAGQDVGAAEGLLSEDRERIATIAADIDGLDPDGVAGRMVAAKGNAHPPAEAARAPRRAAKARKNRARPADRNRQQTLGR